MGNRRLVFVVLLVVAAAAGAQTTEGVLSVDDGVRVRPLARAVGERWVGEKWCVTEEPQTTPSRDRVTVSGDLRLVSTRAITPGSQEWLRLAPTVVDVFERREREQRLIADRTSAAPRAVDWIYAAEFDSRRLYYFEASRRVASPGDLDQDTDPPGTLRIAVAGFLHDEGGRLVPLGAKSELRWEQDGLPAGPARPDLMPLGMVARGERYIWVMKGQSGSSVWFSLYDVSSGGIRTLLTTRGVLC